MLGCCNLEWICTSRLNCNKAADPPDIICFLGITFNATFLLDRFSVAEYTKPYFPRPSAGPILKSLCSHSLVVVVVVVVLDEVDEVDVVVCCGFSCSCSEPGATLLAAGLDRR